MNDRHLSLLFQNYMDRFDEMNDRRHNETYKWEAVQHFQDRWDIQADNFTTMFKKAVGATDNLINNRMVQPTSGIVELSRREPETVRAMFGRLFGAEDGGDLKLRQDRINDFIIEANLMLERYAPGKWKYQQDTRAAIFYLNLCHPDDNYIYKATPARNFGRCMEFGHEIGSGRDFKLSRYYRLCDWLVEAIKAAPELQAVHQSRLGPAAYPDPGFHILAYDIIYCAQSYDLYSNIEFRHNTRHSRTGEGQTFSAGRSARRNRQREEAQARLHERQLRIGALRAVIREMADWRNRLDNLQLVGLAVEHQRFGQGRVTDRQEDVITVRFDGAEKRFALPCAFTEQHLRTENKNVVEACREIAEKIREQERLEMKCRLIQCEQV